MNSSYDIYIHIDATGGRLANGGFVMLNQLAYELERMGYSVAVFDHKNRLRAIQFKWLCLQESNVAVTPFQTVLDDDCKPIITGWLESLLTEDCTLVGGINPRRIRYWGGEILREELRKSREFVIKNLSKIATVNQHLESFYRVVGYEGDIFPLDNWIRRDLFHAEATKRASGSIGYQSDNFVFSIEGNLREAFKDQRVILCEGNQSQTSALMRVSDYFVFWNRHSPSISVFHGETFGMSLFEAMACGCIPIARWHAGISFLWSKIPMFSARKVDIGVIKTIVDHYESNPDEKERVRQESLAIIEAEYRFDSPRGTKLGVTSRADVIERLLK